MIQTVLVHCGTVRKIEGKQKRVLDGSRQCRERHSNKAETGGGTRSPVDVALDSAGLGSRVNRALDTGHGRIPRLVYISGLELDLNYLPALQNRRTTLSSVKARY